MPASPFVTVETLRSVLFGCDELVLSSRIPFPGLGDLCTCNPDRALGDVVHAVTSPVPARRLTWIHVGIHGRLGWLASLRVHDDPRVKSRAERGSCFRGAWKNLVGERVHLAGAERTRCRARSAYPRE